MISHVNITCQKCKKKGHIAKNCPEKKEETKTEGEADKGKDKGKKLVQTLCSKSPQGFMNQSPRR